MAVTVGPRFQHPIQVSTTNPWSVLHVTVALPLAGASPMVTSINLNEFSHGELVHLSEHIFGKSDSSC